MKNILLLDDESDILLLVGLQLKRRGYNVFKCSSIREAEDLINSKQLFACFLDLNLPDGSGFSLVPLIRTKSSDIKILICSAYTNDLEQLEEQYKEKVDFFIGKPIRLEGLKEALDWLQGSE